MSPSSRAETWARLAAAGLVQGEPPAPRARSPWYVRVMQGGSGWFGALFLLGFVGGMFAVVFRSPPATLLLGVVACAGAAVAFRRWPASDFAGQLGFAVSLAGQAMISYGMWKLLGERLGIVATAMALVLATLFVLVPSFLHRVWSAWSAALCVWLAFLEAQLSPLVPGLLAGVFAWLWLSGTGIVRYGERARAAGWALALALVQFPIVATMLWDLRSLVQQTHVLTPLGGVDRIGVGLSAAVLVAVAGWLLVRERRPLTSGPSVVALSGATVVALLTFEAPGLAPAMVVLLVGFAAGTRELAGLGVLALLGYLSHYYYALHATLLEKSMLMAAAGGVLLLAWVALRRLWPQGGEASDA